MESNNTNDYATEMLKNGYTPLMVACNLENLVDVQRLLSEGADVNDVEPNDGETALLQAVRSAYLNKADALKIVTLLLDAGADINAQTKRSGESSVMRALIYGFKDILKLLISRGADVNLRRHSGDTALSSIERVPSAARQFKALIKMIEDAGGVRSTPPVTHPDKSVSKDFHPPRSYIDYMASGAVTYFDNYDGLEGASVDILPPEKLDVVSHRKGRISVADEESSRVDAVVFGVTAHFDCFCFDVAKPGPEYPVVLYEHEISAFTPYADNFSACIKRWASAAHP